MPYEPPLLVALLAASAVLLVVFGLHDGVKPALVAGSVVGGLADVWLLSVMLRGRGKRERFVQTATALAAVYLLFGLAKNLLTLLLPVQQWREQFLAHPGQLPELTGNQTLLALLVTVLGIWQLCVWISTLRRALEIPLAGGVLVFVGLVFASMVVAVVVAGLAGAA